MPILGSQLELYSQLFNGDNERNLLSIRLPGDL